MESSEKPNQVDSREIKLLLAQLQDIKYGSVAITIQDGKIVQIEKSEKIRFKNEDKKKGILDGHSLNL